MIPIYKPYITSKSIEYVNDAMRHGWIAKGEYIDKCEELITQITDSKYCLLTSNGTTANQIISHVLSKKLKSMGRWINTLHAPDNVYLAAWNPFVSDFNLQIHRADLDTFNWTPVGQGNDESLFLIVHNAGNIVNVPDIQRRYPNSIIIEDNCEGFLGKYEGSFSGTHSLMSSISFFGNKTLTSGEGGALLTNDEWCYNEAKSFYSQGCRSGEYRSDQLGYNYRMSNLSAAFLYGQLKDMQFILEKKERIFNRYRENLGDKCQTITENTNHSNWMLAIKTENALATKQELFSYGIESRRFFPRFSSHKNNGGIKKDDALYDTVLMLPSYPELSLYEVDKICQYL